jgi:hypothetical protein
MGIFLITISSLASATPLYCSGKIENTFIEANGNIHIKGSWRETWTKICNTTDKETITCSLWASYVASAVQNNLNVTVNYQVTDGSTCQTLATYANAPKPNYIMIHNPG